MSVLERQSRASKVRAWITFFRNTQSLGDGRHMVARWHDACLWCARFVFGRLAHAPEFLYIKRGVSTQLDTRLRITYRAERPFCSHYTACMAAAALG